MEPDEIFTVLKVILPSKSSTPKQRSDLDISRIVNSLHRQKIITDQQCDQLIHKYPPDSLGEDIGKVLPLIQDICKLITFTDLLRALRDSNYFELCQALEVQRTGLTKHPVKKTLPEDEMLVTHYTQLRQMAEDNRFDACTIKDFISEMENTIDTYQGRSQLYIDKRQIAYFMLAQQYYSIPDRKILMKHMREIMPKGVDRTVFDITYHSLMSINWAIEGNTITSEKHEIIAKQIVMGYNSRLLEIIVSFGSLYKNGELFLQSRSAEYLSNAKNEFFRGMESTVGMDQEEGVIQRSVAMMEHVRPLLGISLDCTVCDITEIETGCIKRARDIMAMVSEDQLTKRRKMKFLVNKGRLYELCDASKAAEYVGQALELAVNENERKNIKKYMEYLQSQCRPDI